MYPNLLNCTSAEEIWQFSHPAGKLEREGNTLTMDLHGLVYRCTVTRQGEVSVRKDTICNTTDKVITVNPISAKFPYPGGEYQVYTQYNCPPNESTGAWQDLVTQIQSSCGSERTTRDATPFLVL